MTRDDNRAQCIEAMADALHDMTDDDPYTRQQELNIAAFILRRLHDIAFVDPIEATEEMVAAGMGVPHHENCCEVFAAMAAAGNLTNPPEEKK